MINTYSIMHLLAVNYVFKHIYDCKNILQFSIKGVYYANINANIDL